VAVDAAYTAQRADAVRCPGLALASRHSHSVQRGGDVLIGPSACHAANNGKRLLGCVTPVFPGSRLANAQLGVLAALPVDDEHDLTGRLVDIDDDLCELRCDQAIVRVASGIAAFSERRIVLGLLQLQLGNAPPVLILVSE